VALHLLGDLFESFGVRAFGKYHRLQSARIVGKRVRHRDGTSKSQPGSNAMIHSAADHLGCTGAGIWRVS